MPCEFTESDDLERIANALIEAYHPHLMEARIRYVFRDEAQKIGGRDCAATATKVPGLYAHLAECDFVIQVWDEAWADMSPEQQVALMDHELCHCGENENGWCLIPHDIEEFDAIVERRGEWDARIASFIDAWKRGPK